MEILKIRYIWMLVIFIHILSEKSVLAAKIPGVVSLKQFFVGSAWTWEYRKNKASVYSSLEKYRVTEIDDSNITMVMSSKLFGEERFTEHHKFIIDLDQCLQAYQNPYIQGQVPLKLFYKSGNNWYFSSGKKRTSPFEEKFNCNAYLDQEEVQYHSITESTPFNYRNKLYFIQTIKQIPINPLEGWFPSTFQNQKEHPFLGDDLRGVALIKVFNPGTSEEYRFELKSRK